MRFAALMSTALLTALLAAPGHARETVEASAPTDVSVTIYRDPGRGIGQQMDREWPQGFAMISETRTVTLPPGESRIRFDGVAEGMVAVSAIVTGLPGGTIEKNRNADLLSPAALVDGTLGNRVTITRTNPGTGERVSQQAIIRTRADGGLVLQTPDGFEAVRCSGLPESLAFDRVPEGLSAKPVFSIDTRDAAGGTYEVVLTYLAWGFDWQAHYVATLGERERDGDVPLRLMSWLTLLNDNGQSFPDAQLLAVAGTINVESDFEDLAEPPRADPLRLTCYPLDSTAAGSPVDYPPPPPPPPPAPPAALMADQIVVTAARVKQAELAAPVMVASEEQLGDLKLYRVPERVTVAAKSMKQVAFLVRDDVKGDLVYETSCDPGETRELASPARMVLETVNDKRHGLGVALPTGGVTIFEPSSMGDLLVAEDTLRDYAAGQDVSIALGTGTRVFARCGPVDRDEGEMAGEMRAVLTNAGRDPAIVRLHLGRAADWSKPRGLRGVRVKDGEYVAELRVEGEGSRTVRWKVEAAGE